MRKKLKAIKHLKTSALCTMLFFGGLSQANAGLIWLDLASTDNLTKTQAQNENQTYRFATYDEVQDIFKTHFEIAFKGHDYSDAAFFEYKKSSGHVDAIGGQRDNKINNEFTAWTDFFGVTHGDALGNFRSYGFVENGNDLMSIGIQETTTKYNVFPNTIKTTDISASFDDTSAGYNGWYMVKDDADESTKVPEPSSLAIFALALFCFGARRLKKVI